MNYKIVITNVLRKTLSHDTAEGHDTAKGDKFHLN